MTPRIIDGVTLSDQTDFGLLARDVLRGAGGMGALRSDNQPLDWILRAYRELAGSPYADRLSEGVAACLTASEPEVRAQALIFFQSNPRAAGRERVRDLVAGDRSLFRGVLDPVHPGTDLDWQLLAALAAQLGAQLEAQLEAGDARTLDLARREVLKPGRAAPLIAALTGVDADWVRAHAEDIVRGTPAAGATLLIQLQAATDVLPLARRITRLCHGDPRFELDVGRFIDDIATREQLLDLFRDSTPSS
ncbi:hypothetical protein J5X84_02205 [Streptosporangiaceae bacterium NEAU-GS5]|nr:hypothetical protein [Streptosporangiaceae bacterium NEAU-GS5]